MIKKGTSRIVWLIPSMGLAIKFPIVRLKLFFLSFFHCLKKPDERLRFFLTYAVDIPYGARWYVLKGFSDNWREFVFFLKHREGDFLLPTFFSFFGLFNISPLVSGLDEKPELERKLWSKLLDITDHEVLKDGHHFSEGKNFCYYKKRLRMSDYGSAVTQKIILKHLDALNQLSKDFQ